MATTFDLLRANDLIWNYVSSNWLMGEDPPAFDILAWNADSTRMPAAMHSFYLRTCYLDNQLARGDMELAGVRLHLDAVIQDLYLVGAVTDHITPWKSSYNTTQLVKGDTRFVLSSSGHIAGIVNPPSPKARHWTNDDNPPDPDVWLAGATEHQGSWWEDWVGWAKAHGGQRRKPPPMGSDRYPPIADPPGSYVHEKQPRPLEDGRDALAATDAHGHQGAVSAGAGQLVQRLHGQDAAGRADRVAERDAAAVRVGALRRQLQVAHDRQRLRGERLVDLEHVDVLDLDPLLVQHRAHGRRRPDTHVARPDPGEPVGHQPPQGRQPALLGHPALGEHHRRRRVVDPGRVPGGHRSVGLEDRLELGHPLQGGVGADVLVGVEDGGALP